MSGLEGRVALSVTQQRTGLLLVVLAAGCWLLTGGGVEIERAEGVGHDIYMMPVPFALPPASAYHNGLPRNRGARTS